MNNIFLISVSIRDQNTCVSGRIEDVETKMRTLEEAHIPSHIWGIIIFTLNSFNKL